MLKEVNDYIVIKLTTGEEVIGKVVEDTANSITLRKPRVLVLQQAADGQQTAGLAPMLQLADPEKNASFMKRYIVSTAPMMDAVKDDYNKATSPLIQASASGAKFQI